MSQILKPGFQAHIDVGSSRTGSRKDEAKNAVDTNLHVGLLRFESKMSRNRSPLSESSNTEQSSFSESGEEHLLSCRVNVSDMPSCRTVPDFDNTNSSQMQKLSSEYHSHSKSIDVHKFHCWTYIRGIVKYGSVLGNQRSKMPLKTDGERTRGHWVGRFDCTVSLVAAVLGLGNLAHFPLITIKHGAGTFMPPFVLVNLLVALPILYLEVCLGQYSNQGAVTGWHMAPLFKGNGVAMWVTSAIMSIYYGVFSMYPLLYFGASFYNPLPWDGCSHPWNTEDCNDTQVYPGCDADHKGLLFQESLDREEQTSPDEISAVNSALEYWLKRVVVTEESEVNIQLVICLFVVWLVCFMTLRHDIRRLGIIMLFNVAIVFMVLIVLTINGLLKLDSGDVLVKFITPDPRQWLHSEIWWDASGEAFFGVLLGTGVLTTLTSYCRQTDGNPFTMVVVVISMDVLTSIFTCFVFYIQMTMEGLVRETPILMKCYESMFSANQLAYIVYPASIGKAKIGSFLCIVFFLAMAGLALTSEIAIVQVIVTSIFDLFPQLDRRRTYVILILCLTGFVFCLPFTLKNGVRWASTLNDHVGYFSLLVNAMLEVIVVAWFYGVNNFCQDIEKMIGEKISVGWKASWKYLNPVFLLVLIFWRVISVHNQGIAKIGLLFAATPFVAASMTMFYQLWMRPSGEPWKQTFKALLRPDEIWYRGHKPRPMSNVNSVAESIPHDTLSHEPKSYDAVLVASHDTYDDNVHEAPRRLASSSVIVEEEEDVACMPREAKGM